MPQTSVVVPTYNRAHMVGNAIQSVLDQTYANWELIVVDDGSQDSTCDVVAGYHDPRIRYIYQENRKLPGARNTGIRGSTGEYVAFLDSDDRFLPEKLAIQVAALEGRPDVGLVASGWTEVDVHGEPLQTLLPWRLERGLALSDWLYACPLIVPAVLVRRDWLMEVGLFDEQQHYVEDWDLWLRMAYAGCHMAWEPAVVCLRTIHESNMAQSAARMIAGRFRMLDKFFAEPGLPDDIRRQRDRVYAGAHLGAAVRAFGAGETGDGEQHLVNALQLSPDLLAGQPPAALASLASSALTNQVRDVQRYVRDLCQSLPRVSAKLARSPRQMWALIRATRAFDEEANGHRQRAWLMAAWTLLTDPAWVRNRGLLRILVKPS